MSALWVHSKLRPNYPTPKIPKNCTSQDIKSGKSPRSGKVREDQKSGCFPASKRARGQKLHSIKVSKKHLELMHLLTLKCVPKGPQSTKMYLEWLWYTILILDYQLHYQLLLILDRNDQIFAHKWSKNWVLIIIPMDSATLLSFPFKP